MSDYPIYSIASAPEQARPALQQLRDALGFLPNVAGAMAGSPVLLNGFIGLFQLVHAGSLSEAQLQTLLLTNAVTNASPWPVAFHSALALQQGVSAADIEAMRRGLSPRDPKLGALSTLARTLIEKRGHLTPSDRERFAAAGFSPEQALEVIAVVAASTITNYTASVTQPPIEPEFERHVWEAASE